MKSAIVAVIASVAIAQKADAKTKSVALAAGVGAKNDKNTSTAAITVAAIANVSGTVTVNQTVNIPAPSSNNIVQSWIIFNGAANDGGNVYNIANGTYGSDVTKAATIATSNKCGKVPRMDVPGSATVINALTNNNCSLNVKQTYTQAATSFTHVVDAAMLPSASNGSLVLGSTQTVVAGWNVYLNPAGTAAIVDNYTNSTATFTLDGALALTLSGAAAAVAALAF